MQTFTKCLIQAVLLLMSLATSACFAQAVGLGGLANDLMEPVTVTSDFVQTACLLIGGAFVFASIIKYGEYKRSPTMVPLSTVIFLLIAGLALLCLPLLSYVTGYGIKYSLFK